MIKKRKTYTKEFKLEAIRMMVNSGRPSSEKEARRRTKVIGAFPDGTSALMLVAARLRHVSTTAWGTRKYMNMKLIE
jgi:transposase-like protein